MHLPIKPPAQHIPLRKTPASPGVSGGSHLVLSALAFPLASHPFYQKTVGCFLCSSLLSCPMCSFQKQFLQPNTTLN